MRREAIFGPGRPPSGCPGLCAWPAGGVVPLRARSSLAPPLPPPHSPRVAPRRGCAAAAHTETHPHTVNSGQPLLGVFSASLSHTPAFIPFFSISKTKNTNDNNGLVLLPPYNPPSTHIYKTYTHTIINRPWRPWPSLPHPGTFHNSLSRWNHKQTHYGPPLSSLDASASVSTALAMPASPAVTPGASARRPTFSEDDGSCACRSPKRARSSPSPRSLDFDKVGDRVVDSVRTPIATPLPLPSRASTRSAGGASMALASALAAPAPGEWGDEAPCAHPATSPCRSPARDKSQRRRELSVPLVSLISGC